MQITNLVPLAYYKFSTKFSKIWVDLSQRLDRGQREHAGAAHGGARAADGHLPSWELNLELSYRAELLN